MGTLKYDKHKYVLRTFPVSGMGAEVVISLFRKRGPVPCGIDPIQCSSAQEWARHFSTCTCADEPQFKGTDAKMTDASHLGVPPLPLVRDAAAIMSFCVESLDDAVEDAAKLALLALAGGAASLLLRRASWSRATPVQSQSARSLSTTLQSS